MEKATIFIPDISGFTEFISQTEIEHSAHIIIELMEELIASNDLGFYLSEVEGDALLYYRTGDTPSKQEMEQQCLKMFKAFHTRLRLLERDTICQCGACQTASNLSIKFIVHAGNLHEVSIAHFTKGAGVDMIIAHRLLKNQVPGDEYILFSDDFIKANSETTTTSNLKWTTNSEAYPAIGAVPYQYTLLEGVKKTIPPAPPKANPSLENILPNDSTITVEIKAPILQVYQTLIDVEKRLLWVSGMKKIERDKMTERAGMKHVCFTGGLRLEHTIIKTDFEEEQIDYYEHVRVKELLLEVMDLYQLKRISEDKTQLLLTISIQKNRLIPKFLFNTVVKGLATDLNNLKVLCEKEALTASAI